MIERWPAGTIGATVQSPEVAMAEEVDQKAHRAWVEVLKGTAVLEDFIDGSLPYQHPDTLVGKKGVGIFREMMDRDDAVSSAISYLGLAALSTGWEMVPASEDGADVEAADFATDALNALKGSPNQMLLSILDSIGMGFSIGEKVWADLNGPDTDWPNKQWLYKIAPRNPVYIEFKLDEHDEIVKDGVWQLDNLGTYTKVDLSEVVYHVHDTRDGSPYGRTPSRRAYKPYFLKDGAFKLWGRFMERYGVPTAWVKYPATGADSGDISNAMTAAKTLRSTLSGAFQDDWDLNLLEPKLFAHKLFQDAITVCNRSINRAFLVPPLVAETSDTGAYALGKVHNDQFIWILNFIRDSLMETVQTQIIQPVVEHNFTVRKYPRFKFKAFAQEDLLAKGNLAKLLVETGVSLSKPKMRENFPELVADADEKPEDVLVRQQPALVDEQTAADFTEIAWDAAHGKLPAQRTLSFAAIPPARLAAEKAMDKIGDSANADFEQNVADVLWGSMVGTEIASAADTLKAQVGKANGGPPQG